MISGPLIEGTFSFYCWLVSIKERFIPGESYGLDRRQNLFNANWRHQLMFLGQLPLPLELLETNKINCLSYNSQIRGYIQTFTVQRH